MASPVGVNELGKKLLQECDHDAVLWLPPQLEHPDLNPARSSALEEICSNEPDNMEWLVGDFEPIGLKQLNAKADMLKRLDNKYVIREKVLRQALDQLILHFDILEIDGKREFTYDTCYFDDAKNSSYFDHLRGRRQRFKVRVRKYLDAKMCFVEMKLKDKRGITIKKRLNYVVEKYGTLDESAWNHIVSSYKELYGRDFAYVLAPVVEMRYKRITLVAKAGGERMTIDYRLAFSGDGRTYSIDENTFIVETKSSNANGIADKILRSMHQHPIKACSKYCVARAALQGVSRNNRFLPALRKLNVVARASVEKLPAVPSSKVSSVVPSNGLGAAQRKAS